MKLYLKYIYAYLSIFFLALAFVINANAAPVRSFGAPSNILPKLHLLNVNEIEAGTLGMNKACNRQVREYGHMLWRDHFNADKKVLRFARVKFVSLQALPQFTQWELRNMQKQKLGLKLLHRLNTCQFDQRFLLEMRDAHAFAIQLVELALQSGSDSDLTPFLRQTLQHLRMHHRMAIQLLR